MTDPDSPNPKRRPPLTPEAFARQRAGQYKGLLRAVAKRKADHSADYATNFDHGQMAPDFERSAAAAGETRKEVRAHQALFDRTLLKLCGFFGRITEVVSGVASRSTLDSPLTPGPSPPRGRGESRLENSDGRFEDPVGSALPWLAGNGLPSEGNGPPSPPWGRGAGGEGAVRSGAGQWPRLPLHTDDASPRAPKLVRALALLAWRPLRLFRTQEHWEWLALCYCLQQLKHWRQKHGELTVERLQSFHERLDAILHNYDGEVERRLKRIENRFWKVWRLYRALVGVVTTVFGSEGASRQTDKRREVDSKAEHCVAPTLMERRGAPTPIPDSRLQISDREFDIPGLISALVSDASAVCSAKDTPGPTAEVRVGFANVGFANSQNASEISNPQRVGFPNSQNASEISNPQSEITVGECAPGDIPSPGAPASPWVVNSQNASEISNPESEITVGKCAPDGCRSPFGAAPESTGPSRASVGYAPAAPRADPHHDQFHPTWLDRLDELTPEAIANPFQSPSHTVKAQKRRSRPAAVKDPKDWKAHPRKPRPPKREFPKRSAAYLARDPTEPELRRMVRKGELTVPGSFEEFADLVAAALGARDSGFGFRGSATQAGDSGVGLGHESPERQPPAAELQGSATGAGSCGPEVRCKSKVDNAEPRTPNPGSRVSEPGSRTPSPESRLFLQALAQSLWERRHGFSASVPPLRQLLEATLVWQPHRFLRLWPKLLPVEYGYDAVWLFRRAHGAGGEDTAWGEPEDGEPRRKRGQSPQPAVVPRSEAEGRQQHAGELQRALRIWFVAVWHALLPVMRSTHKVTVALYEWAVSRFGIREEFVAWRPELSLAQWETRGERPEWAVRVRTVTGKTLVKLADGRIFEPEKGPEARG